MSQSRKYRDYPEVDPAWPADIDEISQSRSVKPGDAYAGNSLPADRPLRFDAEATRLPSEFEPASMKMRGKSKFISPADEGASRRHVPVLETDQGQESSEPRVVDYNPFDRPIPGSKDVK